MCNCGSLDQKRHYPFSTLLHTDDILINNYARIDQVMGQCNPALPPQYLLN